jgi:hypothetical protein
MTITDLVMNFRASLIGLAPCFERVGIPWRRPEAYDEWDDTATALYQGLIVEPLRATLAKADRDSFSLPKYDMLLPTYEGKSVIEVLPARSAATIGVFHAFGTASHPFDVIEFRRVLRNGLPQSEVLETIPLEGTGLALRMYVNGLSAQIVEDVAVPSRRA